MNIPRASIWPNVSFDTTDPDEMAAAEEWVRGLLTDDATDAGSAAVCPGEPRTGRDSTQTPENPNRATWETIDLEPAIGLQYDHLARPNPQENAR